MKKEKNMLLFIKLLILSFILLYFAPNIGAIQLQTIGQSARFGGKFYSVKVFDHGGTNYYLAGTESGFQIYSSATPPVWQDDFPAPAITYTGGASGLSIPNFKTGIDAETIGGTEYAFYADGQNLYALDISTVTAITEADSVEIDNVRAVTVAEIDSGHYYAFALAYQTPGTTMLYIIDIDDPTDMDILQTIDLDKDGDNPNNSGGCAMDFIADLDGDSTLDDPYLFIADGTEGIKAVDLSDLYPYGSRTNPDDTNVTATETDGTANGIDVMRFGSTLYAFVADGGQGLKVFDVTNPSTGMPADDDARKSALNFSYETGYSGQAYDVKLFGTTAFIANGENGVQVVDVSDPNNPVDITLGYDGAADLTYIDSTGSYNRLNGTAYSLDFLVEDSPTIPVVAWGEAGLIKTSIRLDDIDITTVALGTGIVDYIYDGTYIWILDDSGDLTRLTPGTMAVVTTTVAPFDGSGNIVSVGDYIYGIDDADTAQIARVAKTGFVIGSTADTCNDSATQINADAGHTIVKLYTDGTDVFFLDDDGGGDEGDIGRLDVSNFGSAGDMIETTVAVFFDPGATTELAIVGSYIYGVSVTGQTRIRQISKAFAAGDTGVDGGAGALASNVAKIATDGTNVFCVEAGGELSKWVTTLFGGVAGDVITTTTTPFLAAATQPLFIQGGYVYGVENGDSDHLARVPITAYAPTSDCTPSTFDQTGAAAIGYITGDGQDIYMTDAGGLVMKISVDSFGDTDGDGIESASIVQNNENIVVVDGCIFGADDAAVTDMRKAGYKATESTNTIATNIAVNHFSGYAKDIALYTDEALLADYVYVADGEKGIARYTITNPATNAGWAPVVFTDATNAANNDITDPEDIQDARGIDVVSDNSLVLVADGTAGIKLVVQACNSLQIDGAVDTDGIGFMSQTFDNDGGTDYDLGNGIAEGIKYFEFDKGADTDHEYAAVANGTAGVAIIDLSLNDDATLGDMEGVALIDTNSYAYDIAIDTQNDYAYVADGYGGLVIIDLDPNDTGDDITLAALLSGGTYTEGDLYTLRSVVLDDPSDPSYAYLAYGSKGVVILDISDPTNPTKCDSYPPLGSPIDGEAFDLAYDADSLTLYAAMSHGTILAFDVSDPDDISLRGGLDTYGQALGIAYADVDGSANPVEPHLFIADGPGGFLTTTVKSKSYISAILPNIHPVEGGSTTKLIGSGFESDTDGMVITIYNDDASVDISGAGSFDYISSFELTFTAPPSPTGLPGFFNVRTTLDNGAYYDFENGIRYMEEGKAIIQMSAPDQGDGMASPGGQVPIDLYLVSNGAGEITSVTARIEYNITEFEVAMESGDVASSVFEINNSLEKIVAMTCMDNDSDNSYKILTITIYSEETGVNTPIPDGYLGTVYLTVLSSNVADTTISLDSDSPNGIEQQVSTALGDKVEASGSEVNIYIKPSPRMTSTYTPVADPEAGSGGSFGPFTVVVSEALDDTVFIENAEITFTVESDAVINADDPSADPFTVSSGTLSSSSTNSITVYTNTSGEAKISLAVGTKAGDYTMTITGEYNGSTLTATTYPVVEDFGITAETDPDETNDSISLSYTPDSPTTGTTIAVTATAYDRYENPLGNEEVTFESNYGSVNPLTRITSSNGQATVSLTLENALVTHTVEATYDTLTTAELTIEVEGPDVNGEDGWDPASDISAAINYHLEWTDLDINADDPVKRPDGNVYVPGDTNENNRMDLNEVIAIINLSLGL